VAAILAQTKGESIMWWPSWLKILCPQSGKRPRLGRTRKASHRLILETLEGRDVPSYAVTDLGVTAGFASSHASAVNNNGDVAGSERSSAGVSHAFLWHNGVKTDLGTLGRPSTAAPGLNDSGQGVGHAHAATL